MGLTVNIFCQIWSCLFSKNITFSEFVSHFEQSELIIQWSNLVQTLFCHQVIFINIICFYFVKINCGVQSLHETSECHSSPSAWEFAEKCYSARALDLNEMMHGSEHACFAHRRRNPSTNSSRRNSVSIKIVGSARSAYMYGEVVRLQHARK